MIRHVNGVDIYYEEYGEGEHYLFSGQQFHSRISEWTIDLAEHGFHVINVTIRGYGESSMVTEDLGDLWYETWADDICALADALGVERFFYTGWSHGGGIGWVLQQRYPGRVRGFLALAGAPHTKDGVETGAARQATIDAAGDEEKWKEKARDLALFTFPELPSEAPEEKRELRDRLYEESYLWHLNMKYEARVVNPRKPFPKVKTEEELRKTFESITFAPTLLIGGASDNIIFAENHLRTCRSVPHSKLILYQDADHIVPYEHQEEIVADWLSFCEYYRLM